MIYENMYFYVYIYIEREKDMFIKSNIIQFFLMFDIMDKGQRKPNQTGVNRAEDC